MGEMRYRKLNHAAGWKCVMEDLRLQSMSSSFKNVDKTVVQLK